MAASVAIRSAPLKCLRKIEHARSLGGRADNPSLHLASSTEMSFAGTRRLRVNAKKVGRFIVKCLGDLASERQESSMHFAAF